MTWFVDFTRLIPRLRASSIHLGLCLLVSGVLLLLINFVWYPRPFFELASGRDIFLLMLCCDLVLGPVLTLVVFDTRKPRTELVRDLALIVTVQFAALVYGMSSLLRARPAFIVYNVGQFNVTLANEIVPIPQSDPKSSPSLPWFGPKLVGVRMPQEAASMNRLTFSALEGHGDVFQMPGYFIPFDDARAEVKRRARTPAELAKELGLPAAPLIDTAASYAGVGVSVGMLPAIVRSKLALALVDRNNGEYLGIEPIPGQ